MSGYDNHNIPFFNKVAHELREKGSKVLVPHEITKDLICPTWDQCMREDIIELLKNCSMMVMLPGWTKSKGATLEFNLAIALGIPIYFYYIDEWDKSKIVNIT